MLDILLRRERFDLWLGLFRTRSTSGFSRNMTASAGNVRGVANGGKTATGARPSGTRLSWLGVASAGLPPPNPPGVPGFGLPGGLTTSVTSGNAGNIAKNPVKAVTIPAVAGADAGSALRVNIFVVYVSISQVFRDFTRLPKRSKRKAKKFGESDVDVDVVTEVHNVEV